MAELSLLDTVETLKPIPFDRLSLVEPDYKSIDNLPVGQVGTIVEIYVGESPSYLIEFSDSKGREYAMAVLKTDELLSIRYELSAMIS
ncbi:MAG: DUF4926 domain-containing protein [Cyanobacteria bacterium P01_A01_bin.116]